MTLTFFDCGWSLLSHCVAERKRLNLGNLNPIYERELNKLDVHQVKGMCLRTGRGAKDVGISNRRGARARGVREVSATCDSNGVAEADGSLMYREALRPAPVQGIISARLVVPHGGASCQVFSAPMSLFD